MIRVQPQAFDLGVEYTKFKASRRDVGAYGIFVGSVRDYSSTQDVQSMTLEHFPGMTERALSEIETEARKRWELADVLIIHRYGALEAGEDIVLVIAASAHREDAFAACEFLMDWLKTKAPFWKIETGNLGAHWVEAKQTDDTAAARWNLKD